MSRTRRQAEGQRSSLRAHGKTGSVGIDGAAAVVSIDGIVNTDRISGVESRSPPIGDDPVASLLVVVRLSGITDRSWGYGFDKTTINCSGL
jgi:hypothetical protein